MENFVDEQFDSGKPVSESELVLDRSDFLTDESMKKYFDEHPNASREAYDYYLKNNENISTGESTQTITVSPRIGATRTYTLEGLRSGNVVQACYVATSYLYTVQQRNEDAGAEQIMSRFPLDGSSTLTKKDDMILLRFGHGETLQWFDHNGEAYFWIVTKASKVNDGTITGDFDWGTQIGRVQYVPGASIDYTDIARFSSINRANKTGSSFGTLKRCEAALSSSRDKLLIWSMNSADLAQFAYYNVDTLNSILDSQEASGTNYISAGDPSVVKACVASYESANFYSKVVNESVQGFEFSDAQAIYISSGSTDETPVIHKGNWGTTNFTSYAHTISNADFSPLSVVETEGIHLKGDNIYLSMAFHDTNKTKRIYTVPKDQF